MLNISLYLYLQYCGSRKEIQLQDLLFWERDLPFPNSLTGEVRMWQSLWRTKYQEGANLAHNLLSFRSCDADAFPNIHCLLLIACSRHAK